MKLYFTDEILDKWHQMNHEESIKEAQRILKDKNARSGLKILAHNKLLFADLLRAIDITIKNIEESNK